MTPTELYHGLAAAENSTDVDTALTAFAEAAEEPLQWLPLGDRRNNRGTVEVSADPGRSLVERLTNGIDAVIEHEHRVHGGLPNPQSPREAVEAWLGVPNAGLSEMTRAQRQELANRLTIRMLPGEGRESRIVEIIDRGIGLSPDQMPNTILSLNESNKVEKAYLAGAYGQGGSSTYAVSKYSLIASRTQESAVGFTIVRFDEPPPDQRKHGKYVFLAVEGILLQADISLEQFPRGTYIKHFGYDLSSYPSPLGPNSVYGLLNQTLFDPVMPVWFDNRVHNYRRVIKGSRNALNGAVDEGDEARRGPTLSHNVPLFFVSLGDFGRIGIEYWVLEAPDRQNKRPSAAFVNPARPIVLTLNGQAQAELPVSLIRKEGELPYLTQRLICHIECNALSPAAQRALFVSNREDARRGMVYEQIRQELIRVLKSDDDLARVNNEAREQSLRVRDEGAVREMRREVAKLLRLQGYNVIEPGGGGVGDGGGDEPPRPRPRPPRPVQPLTISEPPTYIRLIWEDETPIAFFPEQRRYVRIETDANSTYHDPNNLAASRINLIVTNAEVVLRGSTPLKGGRMRAIFDCAPGATVGGGGAIRVEMMRVGLPVLADQREIEIVAAPPPEPGRGRVEVPPFDWRPIESPDDSTWAALGWPDDVNQVASSAEMEDGTLVIYYSLAFPKFASRRNLLEARDPVLAASFVKRYEIWLAVHSLLMHNDQQGAQDLADELLNDADAPESRDRDERRRLAVMAVLIAAREASLPANAQELE